MRREKFLALQMFAEDPGADGSGGQGSGSGSGGKDGADASGANPNGKSGEGSGENEPGAKYTDEDLDRIISQKFAEWQKKKEKEVSEAQRLADMNAQEKAEYQNKQLQAQIDDLKKREALSKMTGSARSMLADKGIAVSDELLGMMVSESADDTKAAVTSFIGAFQKAVESAVKDALKGEPPKTGTTSGGITKEEILKVKNRTERQKLIRENMNLFK